MKITLERLTPSTGKKWLCLLSGSIWTSIGIFLCSLTTPWLQPLNLGMRLIFVAAGIIFAIGINHYGFSPFADKNIQRIDSYPNDKICVFAFQKWTSYPLVMFMITLGIFLRKYSPIPKSWLAILYIGIGGSLFLASFRYYFRIFQGKLNE